MESLPTSQLPGDVGASHVLRTYVRGFGYLNGKHVSPASLYAIHTSNDGIFEEADDVIV